MEKKITKVIKDNVQTRSTIPQRFVDKHGVTKEHGIEWSSDEKGLNGKLIKPLQFKSNKDDK